MIRYHIRAICYNEYAVIISGVKVGIGVAVRVKGILPSRVDAECSRFVEHH